MFEIIKAQDYKEAAEIICNSMLCNGEDGVVAKTISIQDKKVVVEGIRFKSPLPADVPDISVPSEKLLLLIQRLAETKKSFSTGDGNGGLIEWRYDLSSEEKKRNRNPFHCPYDETPVPKLKAKPRPILDQNLAAATIQRTREELISKLLAELKVLAYEKVRIDEIRPFVNQPREFFDESKLEQLAGSIKYGQRQDVILMKLKKSVGKVKYELIDGERRWRSAIKAGVVYLNAKIYDFMSEKQQALFSAVSNFGREGHTELEEAKTIARTKRDFSFNDTELALIYSKSVTWVLQRLALLKLDERVLEMMKMNGGKKLLDFSRAFLLSAIADHERQLSFAKEILEKNLTLNQAKHLIRSRSVQEGFKLSTRKRKPKDEYRKLSGFLGRTFDDAVIYADMPEEVYLGLFKFRSMSDRDEAMRNIDKIAQLMGILKERMLKLD